MKFHMPSGAEVDIVLLVVKFFPVASGEEFRDMLVAISESPADAPKPTKLDQFAVSHPTFPAAFAIAATCLRDALRQVVDKKIGMSFGVQN